MTSIVQHDLTSSLGLHPQFGNTYSVKPQQVTFIVPGGEDFSPADIASFINKAENLEVCNYGLRHVFWLVYETKSS